jgi:hypothetical protein
MKGEEGVPVRAIAEAIGRGLRVPVVAMSSAEVAGHFGWLAFFAGMDAPASSVLPQQRPGWRPTHEPGLIDDLDHMRYSGDQARGTITCEPRRAAVIDPQAGRAVTRDAAARSWSPP